MNLPELLKIAEAATPGEWKVQLRETEYKEGKTHKEHVIVQSFIHPQLKDHYPIVNLSFGIPKVKGDPAVPLLWLQEENAEFIATFNPTKVSELINRLQEAEKDSARLNWLEKQFGCNLVNDDDSRWAFSDSGMQPIAPEGGFTEMTSIGCWVEPEFWKPSIRQAIDYAKDNDAAINGGKE